MLGHVLLVSLLSFKSVYSLVPASILIYPHLESLQNGVCSDFIEHCRLEINSKGNFYAAIPGGSVLKMLSGLKAYTNAIDWSKVHIFYVNHKCLPPDDISSTHVKAKSLFLNSLPDVNIYPLKTSKSNNLFSDAASIQASMYSQLIKNHVPCQNHLPVFDYMLLGVGKDGHIGSLYPGRSEISVTDAWVVPVDKKSPHSITLTLPVINNAKHIRIVMSGADKAEAVVDGVLKQRPAAEFPVCGVEGSDVKWMVDEAGQLVREKAECTIVESSL